MHTTGLRLLTVLRPSARPRYAFASAYIKTNLSPAGSVLQHWLTQGHSCSVRFSGNILNWNGHHLLIDEHLSVGEQFPGKKLLISVFKGVLKSFPGWCCHATHGWVCESVLDADWLSLAHPRASITAYVLCVFYGPGFVHVALYKAIFPLSVQSDFTNSTRFD